MHAPTQEETLRLYLALRQHQPAWAGALLLALGLHGKGCALALACMAVGGAGLFLESDAAVLRVAQRAGCITCVVSSLEEATRVLKNEVRQGRAIAVALRGDPTALLAEAVRRGLQPQAVVLCRPAQPAEQLPVQQLWRRGSTLLHTCYGPAEDEVQGEALDSGELPAGFSIAMETALTPAGRATGDRALLAAAQQDDVATRWLQAVPGLFPRSLQRAYLQRKS